MKKKKILIILQARSSSKRFPKKVLKKIKGIPLVVLCYKRLTNKNSKAIVATSNKKSDDKLVNILKKNQIPYFRGSLNNVLSRYQKIAQQMPLKNLIIRATSDNPFPDGNLVEIICSHFIKSKKDYMQIESELHGLPKGIRLEIFTVKKLLSLKKNLSIKDKEHVTYKIYKNRKHFYKYIFDNLKLKNNLSKVSVSIDSLYEYKYVKKIFEKFNNPITVSFRKLLKNVFTKNY